jgi:hypothetical protein
MEEITLFEAVDETCDEMYWTVGVWLSIEDAIRNVSTGDCPPEADGACIEDSCNINIYERKIGFGNLGKHVATVNWVKSYHNDDGKSELSNGQCEKWSCAVERNGGAE